MAEGLIMVQYSSNDTVSLKIKRKTYFIVFYFYPFVSNATNDLDEQISIREHLT